VEIHGANGSEPTVGLCAHGKRVPDLGHRIVLIAASSGLPVSERGNSLTCVIFSFLVSEKSEHQPFV
jgi:hypothetical protein